MREFVSFCTKDIYFLGLHTLFQKLKNAAIETAVFSLEK